MAELRWIRTNQEELRMRARSGDNEDIVEDLLELDAQRRKLEDRIDEIRKERVAHQECIGQLSFQNENEAVQSHQEKMYKLGSELDEVRETLDHLEKEIEDKLRLLPDVTATSQFD
ncbi:hypothetical protein [Haloarcula sp. Atlit-7R]|uniref:hypothetical protein n=1 Tax=Haloarcula sp. Atlit-7R TaxID=2282125 RepID=UPI001314CCBD|nr:hypothetical protein [Haloarcula sp. Atlit-7R]